eukprot:10841385-Heterocapsa_arctica.AAC.1
MIGRSCNLPDSPKPNLHRIAGSVLAAGDSAAGIDGWPYEVYHVGVNLVSHLLGNAHYAANISDAALLNILGPNDDLL